MDAHEFLGTLVLVLITAGISATLFQRLRLPVVFGYMAAGLIISPHFPLIPLDADEQTVRALAELGVILLMFVLGLEFSLRRVIKIFPTAGVIGVAQTSFMGLIGFLIGQAMGWTVLESVFTGAIIAISSTTIIVKAFEEQGIKGGVTDLVFGILIVEDLVAILLLAVLTTASAQTGFSLDTIAATSARLLVFLTAFLVIGLLIIPRLTRYLVQVGRSETIVVAMVGLAFGSALVALAFDYSVALGAFMAGALAAESGVASTVEHVIQPARDLFAAIFFVAVGMLIDPALVAEHWVAIVLLTAAVIAGKVVAVSISAFLTGYSVPTSVRAGMSLAQIGEFSFIIAGVGLASSATRPFVYPVAVAVSAFTTLTTPWLIRVSQQAANRVDRSLPRPLQTFVSLYGSWIERMRAPSTRERGSWRLVLLLFMDVLLIAVLVIGFALELPRLTSMLSNALAFNASISRAVVLGAGALIAAPLLFGLLHTSRLLARRLALRALPAAQANQIDYSAAPRRALTTTLQLALVGLAGIVLVATTQPFLPAYRGLALLIAITAALAFTFWRNAANLQGHARAGAEILAHALASQLPGSEPTHHGAAPSGASENLARLMNGFGEPVAWRITDGSSAVGRTLAELNLRASTGATVLAIYREGEEVALPTGRERMQPGDVLVLAGTHDAIEAAQSELSRTE